MHFVSFAFDVISKVRIFYFAINNIVAISKILSLLFSFNFGIVRFLVMDVVMLLNFYSVDFSFMISGYNMALTNDSDTKNISV